MLSPSATGSHNSIARWIANILEEANPGDDYFVTTDISANVDDHNEPRPDMMAVVGVSTPSTARSRSPTCSSPWR